MSQPPLRLGALTMLVAAGALAGEAISAAEYVPGRHRPDGLYIQPHFREPGQRAHAAEAWYDGLAADRARAEAVKPPPQPVLEPPAASRAGREPQI